MWEAVPSLDANFSPTRRPAHDKAPPPADFADGSSAEAIFQAGLRRTYVESDRLFAGLIVLQWIAGIAIAVVVSPYTWIGDQAQVHQHIWAAIFLGAAIAALPLMLIWKYPGEALTRHVVAVAQMMSSVLLIHLTGGRIETHFHIFVSLAFLALYRDWHILVTATVVVAVDHFVRGIWWPISVFGVTVESPYRWIEHAVWVVFEDIILIRSGFLGRRKMWAVAEREAKLSIANRELEAQNIERRKAEAEVRRLFNDATQAHEEAIAASRVKSQFLANMSHELRTPLNAILGYTELLQIGNARRQDTRDNADLQRIHKAGTHLLSLINDILDISKIEAGKMQLEMRDFALEPLLDDVGETVRPLAESNRNTFETDFADDIGPIHADALRLKQCLLNLLSNACKFTKDGRVTFSVRREMCEQGQQGERGEAVLFRITDTGVGLSDEQIARLFLPFTQADESTTRRFGGTGLGLAITKKLIDAMGGTISVKSSLGSGSTFTIELPLRTIDAVPAAGLPQSAHWPESSGVPAAAGLLESTVQLC